MPVMEVVGRSVELDLIWTAMSGSPSRAALLSGPGGIGKTAVLDAARGLLARESRVLAARGVAAESGLPFAALGALLAPYHDEFKCLPLPQRDALRAALALNELPQQPAQELAVSLAVTSLLEHLQRDKPLALVLDDVQDLDVPSASALAFAIRRLAGHTAAVLMALRTPHTVVPGGLLGALPTGHLGIDLGPLTPGDLAAVLHHHLGQGFGGERLQAIIAAAQGNTMAAIEFARAEVHGRRPRPSDSLRQLLTARLVELDRPAQELLRLVAVAGRLPTSAVPASGLAITQTIAAAVDASLLTIDPDDALRFTHPMLAIAMHDVSTPADLRAAHHTLAATASFGVEQRARHAAAACLGTNESVAAQVDEAADNAERRAATWTAAELSELACRLTPASSAASRVRRGIGAGLRFFTANATDKAGSILEFIAPDIDDNSRAEYLLVRSNLVESERKTRLALLSQVVELAAPGSVVRAEAMTDRCGYLIESGRASEALASIDLAVDAARNAGSTHLVGSALHGRLRAEFMTLEGDPEATLQTIRAELAADDSADLWEYRRFADSYAANRRGDRETALRVLTELIDRLADRGQARTALFRAIHRPVILAELGRLDAAREAMSELLLFRDVLSSVLLDQCELTAAAHSGDITTVRRLAPVILDHARGQDDVLRILSVLRCVGLAELAAGEPTAAFDALSELRSIATAHKIRLQPFRPWQADFVEAALQRGKVDEARTMTAEFSEVARISAIPEMDVLARRCQALLAAAEANHDRSLKILKPLAQREHDHIPLEFGRTLLALGIAERRAKQRAAARTSIEAAHRIFVRVQNPPWAQRALNELGRTGIRTEDGALTATEQAIATLAAQGQSNSEIAASMYLSIKTVEHSLTNVYQKLGIRSRSQLNAKLNLLTPPGR